MTTPTPRTATPAPRVHLSEAEVAELRAELDRARADLDRALELIAELRDVGERADRAFARYDTGGGETPPDLGSAPRARGVAAGGPESAVDGRTPLTGSRGMGRGGNGAQNAAQAVQDSPWHEPSEPGAGCGCPHACVSDEYDPAEDDRPVVILTPSGAYL